MRRAVLAALAATACGGSEATLSLELVFPPGEDGLPAEAERVRLTLSDPPEVVEADVAADGSFALSLEAEAFGATGDLTFEALDASGDVISRGRTPPMPVALVDGTLAIYIGRPGAFTEAPWSFDGPRDGVAAVPQEYGFLVAGGRDADGNRTGEVFAYSAYVHEPSEGLPLPEPRSDITAVQGPFGAVFLFGGIGAGEVPTSSFLWFDTTLPPAGAYTEFESDASLARAGAPAAQIAVDRWIVAGDPLVLLDPAAGRAVAMTNAPGSARLATAAATTFETAGAPVAVLIHSTSVVLYHPATDTFQEFLDTHAATDPHDAVTLPGGDVLAFSDAGLAVRVAPTGQVTEVAMDAVDAAAVIEDLLVVTAGAEARIIDGDTLETISTAPLVAPRTGATLVRLPNRTLALVGGGVATVEFFTP